MIEAVFFWASVAFYAAITVCFWIAFIFRKERLEDFALMGLWPGLVLHGAAIVIRWVGVGHGPYINRYEVLSSNTWIVLCVYLISQHFFKKLRPVGAVVVPLGLLMMGFASIFPPEPAAVPPTFRSNWLIVHILFAKLAYGALAVGTGLSLFYILKSGRQRETGVYSWLPGLEVMDELIYRFMLLGFFGIAVMIIAGSLWAKQSWGRYWGWDPIETWALLTWLVYGIYLHLRRTRGWKGKQAAWLSLGAFLLVVIFAFGVTTFIKSIHSYYFVK